MKTLKEIILTPTEQMFSEIQKEIGNGNTDGTNFLYFPSKSPLILQAHIDTVRRIIPQLSIENKIIKSNGIMGADDRAGVYALLQTYHRTPKAKRPSLLFTNHEEIGGHGMKKFLKKNPKRTLTHVNLLIAVDRQGANEYVYYNAIHSKVKDFIKSFGYIEENGTYSDCQNFTSKSRIPSVNVSCGYYNQHAAAEELHIDELDLTINRLIDICQNPLKTLYPVDKQENYRLRDYYYGSDYAYTATERLDKCAVCDSAATLRRVLDDGFQIDVCYNCFQTYYGDNEHSFYDDRRY